MQTNKQIEKNVFEKKKNVPGVWMLQNGGGGVGLAAQNKIQLFNEND